MDELVRRHRRDPRDADFNDPLESAFLTQTTFVTEW